MAPRTDDDKWTRKPIEIHWVSEDFRWLDAHEDKPRCRFRLTSVPSQYATVPTRYLLAYDGDDMLPMWQGMSFISIPGTDPVPPVSDLPPWTAGSDFVWTSIVGPIADSLRSDTTDFPRLEGYLPVMKDNVPTFDRVRMMYLQNAITDPSTKLKSDVVVVSLNYADGEQEDGAGSGPPR